VSDGPGAPQQANGLVFHLKEDLWGAFVIARRELWANLKSLRTVVMVLLLALIMLGAAAGFASLSNSQDTGGRQEAYLALIAAMDPDGQLDDLVVFVHVEGTYAPVQGRNVSLAVESALDPSLATVTGPGGIAVLKNLTAAFHILEVELWHDTGLTTGVGVEYREDVSKTDIFVPGGTWAYPAIFVDAESTDLDDDNYDDDMVVWVVGSGAAPVAGAAVTVSGNSSGTAPATATVDANGIARFEGLSKGGYLVVATDGNLTGSTRVDHKAEQVDRGLFFISAPYTSSPSASTASPARSSRARWTTCSAGPWAAAPCSRASGRARWAR
jgi:hypothetical protein